MRLNLQTMPTLLEENRDENNGIKYSESWIETTLFDLLNQHSPYNSAFSTYSYNLEKIYNLRPDTSYHEYDKMYARQLLEGPKERINRYVYFTNTEPDAERVVLVRLAMYLESLSRKNLLNKNIPNTLEYRVQVLSEEQYADLLAEEEIDDPQDKEAAEDFQEMLKKYGG